MFSIIDVETGELVAELTLAEVIEFEKTPAVIVPAKRLYTNYGFIDNNPNHIYVIRK